MIRAVFNKSHFIHKYLGLSLILYGMIMGFTGIFINHPEWIEKLSIPASFVPNQYQPRNWDRNTMVGLTYDATNPDRLLAFGDEGVWESVNAGRSFHSYMNNGFPQAPYLRKTNDLIIIPPQAGNQTRVIAATRAGLFDRSDNQREWRRISLGPIARDFKSDSSKDDEVLSLLTNNNQIIAVTRDGFFLGSTLNPDLPFHPLNVGRTQRSSELRGREPMIAFLFDLHSGRILGLEGRLLFDIVGVIIILLCISAFYLWYYPKRIRRARKIGKPIHTTRRSRTLFRLLFHYHLKIGAWVTPVILIMAFTGFFMRPPLIILPARITVPAWWMPLQSTPDQWAGRIKNATLDPATKEILVECTDGFWSGPADFSEPLQPTRIGLPVHVMGTTVLKYDQKYGLIAGSFSGIYNRNRINTPQTGSESPLQKDDQQQGGLSTQRNEISDPNHAKTGAKKYFFREQNQAKHRAENRARNFAHKNGHPPDNTTIIDTTTGKQVEGISTLRLGTHMVTAFFRTPQGDEYIATFRDGLIRLNNNDNSLTSDNITTAERFPMPEELRENYRMSLWKYAFELHNGRFFKDWVGSSYLLIPIIGSLLFFLLAVTGIFDWAYIQLVKNKV